eukprot:CAMPEP_0196804810 /NCGR_PEP_ID=MMETSP1362-20130617/4485_1 /TAXON_ID=163516 /ORGANISM="Leptocylindrus danicus, Strain CCMP1856" /LENGTH=136 /DNA_ID=CAMNT_0042177327 /DNA_START=112 /DNA_END=522 /DNA_ORIENTATION=-
MTTVEDLVGAELVGLAELELAVMERKAAVEVGQCCDATHVAAGAMEPGIVHKGTRISAAATRTMREVRLQKEHHAALRKQEVEMPLHMVSNSEGFMQCMCVCAFDNLKETVWIDKRPIANILLLLLLVKERRVFMG